MENTGVWASSRSACLGGAKGGSHLGFLPLQTPGRQAVKEREARVTPECEVSRRHQKRRELGLGDRGGSVSGSPKLALRSVGTVALPTAPSPWCDFMALGARCAGMGATWKLVGGSCHRVLHPRGEYFSCVITCTPRRPWSIGSGGYPSGGSG